MRSQIESNRNRYAGALQTVQKFAGNDSINPSHGNPEAGSHQWINWEMVVADDSVLGWGFRYNGKYCRRQ